MSTHPLSAPVNTVTAPDHWGWLLCTVAAIAVHAAVVSVWLMPAPSQSGEALNAGKLGVEVGLGQAGASADLVKQLLPQAPEPVQEPEQKPVPKQKPIPKKTTRPEPKPTPMKKPLLDVKTPEALPSEPDAIAISAPEPELPEVDEAQPPKQPDAVTEALPDPEPDQRQTSSRPQSDVAAVKGTGESSDQTSGGKIGNARDYISHLMRTLLAHHKYPVESRKHKEEGKVIIKFTIDRQGQVLSSAVKTSSGYPSLDRAALRMLDEAAPLPSVPEALFPGRQRLPLVVPVEYELITNATYER